MVWSQTHLVWILTILLPSLWHQVHCYLIFPGLNFLSFKVGVIIILISLGIKPFLGIKQTYIKYLNRLCLFQSNLNPHPLALESSSSHPLKTSALSFHSPAPTGKYKHGVCLSLQDNLYQAVNISFLLSVKNSNNKKTSSLWAQALFLCFSTAKLFKYGLKSLNSFSHFSIFCLQLHFHSQS